MSYLTHHQKTIFLVNMRPAGLVICICILVAEWACSPRMLCAQMPANTAQQAVGLEYIPCNEYPTQNTHLYYPSGYQRMIQPSPTVSLEFDVGEITGTGDCSRCDGGNACDDSCSPRQRRQRKTLFFTLGEAYKKIQQQNLARFSCSRCEDYCVGCDDYCVGCDDYCVGCDDFVGPTCDQYADAVCPETTSILLQPVAVDAAELRAGSGSVWH